MRHRAIAGAAGNDPDERAIAIEDRAAAVASACAAAYFDLAGGERVGLARGRRGTDPEHRCRAHVALGWTLPSFVHAKAHD
jgi:hypothetical protein